MKADTRPDRAKDWRTNAISNVCKREKKEQIKTSKYHKKLHHHTQHKSRNVVPLLD